MAPTERYHYVEVPRRQVKERAALEALMRELNEHLNLHPPVQLRYCRAATTLADRGTAAISELGGMVGGPFSGGFLAKHDIAGLTKMTDLATIWLRVDAPGETLADRLETVAHETHHCWLLRQVKRQDSTGLKATLACFDRDPEKFRLFLEREADAFAFAVIRALKANQPLPVPKPWRL